MRIASLLPSATEILFALGLDREVVAVSHECDYPPEARTKRVVVRSRIPREASPLEIDTLVREYLSRGESLYAVDVEALEQLRPDLIVTQDLCHVCAASPDDLRTGLARFANPPEVLSLNPQDLSEVWRDIVSVGQATGRRGAAEALRKGIAARIDALEARVSAVPEGERPRVALLEWLEPFYVGGHWVPEMLQLAGGNDVFGRVRMPSFRITAEDLVKAAPEVLLVACCGYQAEQCRDEFLKLPLPEAWNQIPAVRNNRVYACEAASFFSRPGPRLITGIEALANLFHPQLKSNSELESPGVVTRISGSVSTPPAAFSSARSA